MHACMYDALRAYVVYIFGRGLFLGKDTDARTVVRSFVVGASLDIDYFLLDDDLFVCNLRRISASHALQLAS